MWLPELQPSQPHSEAGTSRASVKRPFVLSGSVDCSATVTESLREDSSSFSSANLAALLRDSPYFSICSSGICRKRCSKPRDLICLVETGSCLPRCLNRFPFLFVTPASCWRRPALSPGLTSSSLSSHSEGSSHSSPSPPSDLRLLVD